MRIPKARHTYVVSYYKPTGEYYQEYYQNRRKAQSRANALGMAKGKANVNDWIDGAEMVRLARLGYVYDATLGIAVKHSIVKRFAKYVDSLPKAEREAKFLDYRKFKTLDDVLAFHQKKLK